MMLRNFNRVRIGLGTVAASVLTVMCLGGFAGAGVTLPDDNADAANELRSYLIDVNGGHYDAAADRYWSLANNHGHDLVSKQDGGFVCVRDAIDSVSTDDLTKVAAELRKRHGADAAAVVAAAMADPKYSPQDLYTASMKTRHNTEAATAMAAAAARALSQGDSVTAAVLSSKPAPESSAQPLPFAAGWWENAISSFSLDKSIPVLAGDTVLVSGPTTLVAMTVDGHEKWSVAAGETPAYDRMKIVSLDRGIVSIPAVLTDDAGKPQIVVARLTSRSTNPRTNFGPDDNMTGGWLAGYRAADGRELWSTQKTLPGTMILSSATIAGRFAYCIGLEPGTDPSVGDLQLIAVDVTSGRAIWKTRLAAVTELPLADRGGGVPWLAFFFDQGPPAVSGSSVVVTPGIGAVMAIDRFDGTLRWIRPYTTPAMDENILRIYRQQRLQGARIRPMLPWPQLQRWTNTPVIVGGIVVAAPQDTNLAMGIDLSGGKQLWQSNALPEGVPVAAAGGDAIWAGKSITAVDPKSGQGQTWNLSGDVNGVPVVRGDKVIARTAAGLVAVQVHNRDVTVDPGGPDFTTIASAEAGKAALHKAKLSKMFDVQR